jgi:hypothetical protein
MLDEEHEQLKPVRNDDNCYLLGQVVKHNIVITSLGSGM